MCVCRRRLPVLMVKLRMAQRLADAIKFIEQGRILYHKFEGEAVCVCVCFLCFFFCWSANSWPFLMQQ